MLRFVSSFFFVCTEFNASLIPLSGLLSALGTDRFALLICELTAGGHVHVMSEPGLEQEMCMFLVVDILSWSCRKRGTCEASV